MLIRVRSYLTDPGSILGTATIGTDTCKCIWEGWTPRMVLHAHGLKIDPLDSAERCQVMSWAAVITQHSTSNLCVHQARDRYSCHTPTGLSPGSWILISDIASSLGIRFMGSANCRSKSFR